jgi:hypothetical protein
VATVRPLRTPVFGGLASQIPAFMATAVAARHYAHNLLLDSSTRFADLDAAGTAALAEARAQLADSAGAVTAALCPAGPADGGPVTDGDSADGASANGVAAGRVSISAGGNLAGGDLAEEGTARQYVRSASLFARVADTLPDQSPISRAHLALRDLQLLDGALAEAAKWAGVPVTDLDTVPASRTRGALAAASGGATSPAAGAATRRAPASPGAATGAGCSPAR